MLLKDIESNSTIFIDTNIFLYDISSHSVYGEPCKEFLKRVERNEVEGKTSVVVLNELLHKLILGEVSKKRGVTLSQTFNYLKKNPDVLSSLEAYGIADKIEKMQNLTILEVAPAIFTSAREYMKKFKLMSNDAINVATCKIYGIENIATSDADFERVDFLKVWKP